MKLFFDTSALVAALVKAHPRHKEAAGWLRRVIQGKAEGGLAAHSLAELYAVLTRLPVAPRISPGTAWRLIGANIDPHFSIVALNGNDYKKALRNMAAYGFAGGVIYDGLIAAAALKYKPDHLLTLNPGDFERLSLKGPDFIKPV